MTTHAPVKKAEVASIGSYRWGIVFCLFLLYLINYFDRLAVLTFLPLIRADIKLTHEQIGLAASIFFFGYALAQLSSGWLTDRIGAKKVMTVAIVVFTGVTFITGLVQNYLQFFLCRLGLAVGEGHHYVPAQRCMAEWIPQKEKGRASAFFGTIYAIAPAVIPPAVALLAFWFGSWREVFFVLAIPGLVGMAVLYFFVFNSAAEAHAKGRISTQENDYIQAGLVAEGGTKSDWEALKYLYKDRSFVIYSFVGFCGTGMYWGSTTWISSFLMEQHNFSLKAMGWMAAVPYVTAFLAISAGGIAVDKYFKGSVKPVLWLCFVPSAILFFVVAQVPRGEVVTLVVLLAVMGFFVNLYSGAQYAYPLLRYPREVMGKAIGFSNFVWQMGAFVAPMAAGYLVTKTAEGFSYAGAFSFFAAMSLVGAILVCFLDESHLRKTTDAR